VAVGVDADFFLLLVEYGFNRFVIVEVRVESDVRQVRVAGELEPVLRMGHAFRPLLWECVAWGASGCAKRTTATAAL
jgi:hypothetical protein